VGIPAYFSVVYVYVQIDMRVIGTLWVGLKYDIKMAFNLTNTMVLMVNVTKYRNSVDGQRCLVPTGRCYCPRHRQRSCQDWPSPGGRKVRLRPSQTTATNVAIAGTPFAQQIIVTIATLHLEYSIRSDN
jgi:hypothetical protein